MKTKHIVIAFIMLSLLLASSFLLTGNYDRVLTSNTYLLALGIFIVVDVLLGFVLIFGKVKFTRKRNRNFDYLKTHYL